MQTNTGPDPDDDDMFDSITTLTDGAAAVAIGTHRNSTFTSAAGETDISINNSTGSGGDLTTLSIWYEVTATAGSVQLGEANDLSTARDWTLAIISLKPAAAGAGDAGRLVNSLRLKSKIGGVLA